MMQLCKTYRKQKTVVKSINNMAAITKVHWAGDKNI